MSNFTEKFRQVWNVIAPSLMVLMVVASFALSVASLTKSVKTDAKVNRLTESFETTVADMNRTLSAMEGHLAFLEKYLGDHASFFYDNDRVVINNKTKSKK